MLRIPPRYVTSQHRKNIPMDTTHFAICGCTNPDCAWKDGRTWDVVRLDETLERVIVQRHLFSDQAFIEAQFLNDSVNPSAPIVYIVCAPEGVISFEEVA